MAKLVASKETIQDIRAGVFMQMLGVYVRDYTKADSLYKAGKPNAEALKALSNTSETMKNFIRDFFLK